MVTGLQACRANDAFLCLMSVLWRLNDPFATRRFKSRAVVRLFDVIPSQAECVWTIKRINCQSIPCSKGIRGKQDVAIFCKLHVVAGGGRTRKNRVVVVSLCVVSTTVPWSIPDRHIPTRKRYTSSCSGPKGLPAPAFSKLFSISASRFVGLASSSQRPAYTWYARRLLLIHVATASFSRLALSLSLFSLAISSLRRPTCLPLNGPC